MGSMLLFNTNENPYKEYKALDNLFGGSGKENVKSVSDRDNNQKLSAAPSTIIDGDILPEIGAFDVGFKPKMKALNDFDLPSNLDLPDIADIALSGVTTQSIAPSSHSKPSSQV